jgi:UDP-glucuronate 4-epimerase
VSTLITGCSGFVGLALAEHLLAAGEDVVSYDQVMPPDRALGLWRAHPGSLIIEQGDVCDEGALRDAMIRHRPRRLVTLAAITADAERERATPKRIFEVNVGGVLAAISAAADAGVQRVLHVSSGAAYGASGREQGRLHEDRSPLLPEGLYGISKRSAEDAAKRLAALVGLPLVIGRLGTCFGPWETDSGVRDTPSAPLQALRLARQGLEVILPRDSRRDWLYVRDAAAAMTCLLATSTRHTVYNLAAGNEWSMVQWCECVAARYPGFTWRVSDSYQSANVDYYADYDRASMDIDRLLADTDFLPGFDLEASCSDFLEWWHFHADVSLKWSTML